MPLMRLERLQQRSGSMSEASLSTAFRKHLGKHGHIERVENMVNVGTPDVNYVLDGCEGWVELKCIPAWPVRSDTLVRVPHYTPEQRIWHRERKAAGGKVFVLLRVDSTKEYLLFDAGAAANKLGYLNKEQTINLALVHARGKFPVSALLSTFTSAA